MDYSSFLKFIFNGEMDEKKYNKLKKTIGYKKLRIFYERLMDTKDLSDNKVYEVCRYFLEDELNIINNEEDLKVDDSLALYLGDISLYHMLSESEEKDIFNRIDILKKEKDKLVQKIDIDKYIQKYGINISVINNIILNNESSNCLLKDLKIYLEYLILDDEYRKLSNKVIESNLRLVVSIAKHYRADYLDILDLIQEGNMALNTAIDKFDINRNTKFSTYATLWIRQRIVRTIQQFSKTVHVPVNKQELYYTLNKVTNLYENKYGKTPNDRELLEFISDGLKNGYIKSNKYLEKILSYDLNNLNNINQVNQKCVSLFSKIAEGEDSEIVDFIQDKRISVEDNILKESVSNDIKKIINHIEPKQRLIIILRYGFSLCNYMSFDEFLSIFNEENIDVDKYNKLYSKLSLITKPLTLEKIGEILNLTRERIRQIECKTMRKIKVINKREKTLQADLLELYK